MQGCNRPSNSRAEGCVDAPLSLRGYPKSFVGVFWGLMRRLGNGTRVGCQATVSEASGGCC